IRVIREGRADSTDQALEVVKEDLKALNRSVRVSQQEYVLLFVRWCFTRNGQLTNNTTFF
ncbi:MAG: hypothetical protein II067_10560, partial [Agathobacter sp.]|nr:hypothetical protein [Agathobacter sp.]